MKHKTFQTLRYHTDVVRGEYLLYIARPLVSWLPTNTPLLESSILSSLNSFTLRNFEARTLRFFCIWKLIYSFSIPCCLFFLILKGCASYVDLFQKNNNKWIFFRKRIRYLKYKQNEVL